MQKVKCYCAIVPYFHAYNKNTCILTIRNLNTARYNVSPSACSEVCYNWLGRIVEAVCNSCVSVHTALNIARSRCVLLD